MTLYQKHRPTSFKEIVGNEGLVESLQSLVSKEDRPHAFLFGGPSGCGKTTLARILAQELGCDDRDYLELDTADFRGIDTVRGIRQNMHYTPIAGTVRVWVLDECHKQTNDAQNALLKALEEPPPHVYFILCTTQPQSLLDTIRNRCERYFVSTLTEDQIVRLLRRVVKGERGSLSREVYYQIAESSQGSPRAALTLLEQVIYLPKEQQVEAARRAADQKSEVIELARALISRKGWKQIRMILTSLKDAKEDEESIRRLVLAYCQSVLLGGNNDQAAETMELFLDPFYNTGWPGLVFACYCVTKA